MRGINFRAWFTLEKRMVEHENLNLDYGKNEGFSMAHDDLLDIATFNFDLMQYTGLKDKNGKEIYEGDILKHCHPHWGHKDEQLRLVEWKNESSTGQLMNCGFKFSQVGKGMFTYYTPEVDLEIIGNIWEHPHLLDKAI